MILVVTVGTIGVDCHYVAGGAVTLETGSLGGWGREERVSGVSTVKRVRYCGVKPCPDPTSIRHHWWSSGQDLCFWCRGSPVARVRTPVGAEVGGTSESPPKW